jgi:hypothetical protein
MTRKQRNLLRDIKRLKRRFELDDHEASRALPQDAQLRSLRPAAVVDPIKRLSARRRP